VPVVGGRVTINVTVDSMYTLTTVATGNKGTYPNPPTPAPFPPVYADDYNACITHQEVGVRRDGV